MSDKHQRLVQLLSLKTLKGELPWEEGFDDYFQVSFTKSSVRIRENEKRQASLITIELINEDGSVVDSFTDEDLDSKDQGLANAVWFRRMKELFELVRRTARGAEKVLNDVLNELEDDIPF